MDGKSMNNNIKVGDWVKCVNDLGANSITQNKIYQVLEITLNKFALSSDDGRKLYWYKERFVKYVNKKNHLPVWF